MKDFKIFETQTEVNIPDVYFKIELQKKIYGNEYTDDCNCPIYKEYLAEIDGLDMISSSIADITGIRYCIALTDLSIKSEYKEGLFPSGQIEDISELQ